MGFAWVCGTEYFPVQPIINFFSIVKIFNHVFFSILGFHILQVHLYSFVFSYYLIKTNSIAMSPIFSTIIVAILEKTLSLTVGIITSVLPYFFYSLIQVSSLTLRIFSLAYSIQCFSTRSHNPHAQQGLSPLNQNLQVFT